MGMRKDFIIKKVEKKQRNDHVEENENISSKDLLSSSNPLSNSESSLQTSDEIDQVSFLFIFFNNSIYIYIYYF